jgi:hypothetical protein
VKRAKKDAKTTSILLTMDRFTMDKQGTDQSKEVVVDCNLGVKQYVSSPLELLTRAYHQATTEEIPLSLPTSHSSILKQVEDHVVSEASQSLVASVDSDDSVSLSDLSDCYLLDAVEDNVSVLRVTWMLPEPYRRPNNKSRINESDVFIDSLHQVHGQRRSVTRPTTDDESWTVADLLYILRVFVQPHDHPLESMILVLTLTSHPFRIIYTSDVILRRSCVGAPLFECICPSQEGSHSGWSFIVTEQRSTLMNGGENDNVKTIPVVQHQGNGEAELLYYVIFLQKDSSPLGSVALKPS